MTGVRYSLIVLFVGTLWQSACTRIDVVDEVSAQQSSPAADCGAPPCALGAGRRISNPPKPLRPVPQGIAVPTFTPENGRLPYGSTVNLSVSKLAAGAVFDYSYDSGKTWTTGAQVPVITSSPILARTRINDLVSEPTQASFSPYFQRMLIVGNSIMEHGPAPNLGWYNSNGMAASAPEKDFVHLLTKQLTNAYPQATVKLLSGGLFEQNFAVFNLDEYNELLQQFKPDLIVVRIAENVNEGNVNNTNFALAYERLLDRLVRFSGPAKVVCTTSVWKRPKANDAIRKVAAKKGYALVELSIIEGKDQFFAFTEYKNAAVGAHPNDVGMQRIADLIWDQVRKGIEE